MLLDLLLDFQPRSIYWPIFIDQWISTYLFTSITLFTVITFSSTVIGRFLNWTTRFLLPGTRVLSNPWDLGLMGLSFVIWYRWLEAGEIALGRPDLVRWGLKKDWALSGNICKMWKEINMREIPPLLALKTEETVWPGIWEASRS